jgi:hypothetical protein
VVSSLVAAAAGTVETCDTAGVDNGAVVVHNLVAVATAVVVAFGIVDTVSLAMVVVVAYYSPKYISK